MATWKKLVVSGSGLQQLDNSVTAYITAADVPAALPSFNTASINGVDLLADHPSASFSIVTGSADTGLTIAGNAGTDTITFDLSSIPNSTLANDSVTIGTTEIDLGNSSTTLAGLTSVTSTGFTGSLSANSVLADGVIATTQSPGDNSTKVATTEYVDNQISQEDLDFIGDAGSTGSVDLDSQTLKITGGNGLETTAGNQLLTVNITNDNTSGGNVKPLNVSANGLGFDISNIDGDGLTTSGGELAVNVDNSTVEINSDTLRVKDLGITNAKIANTTIANAKLVNDSITIGAHEVELGDSVTLAETGFNSGSFSGSFQGDGSNLTGIASTLTLTGSYDGNNATPGTVNLKTEGLIINGFVNEISASFADGSNTLELRLPEDVIVQNDLTVNGDLIVNGTASFRHEDILEIADQFILLNSGSQQDSDGGIVVQQGTQDVGDVFGFDNQGGAVTRWGVAHNFHSTASAFTPDGYVSINLTGPEAAPQDIEVAVAALDSGVGRYNAEGNIWTDTTADQGIWIYS